MEETTQKLAVLYADVSGSTRLYEQHGDTVARADIALCLEILAQTATGLGGRILKTIGDEIMCAFQDAAKAAMAASEMQAGLSKASQQGRFTMGTLRIKIGWHYGATYWRDDDLLGEAPVTAQQVIRLAKADEILTSRQSIAVLPPALIPNAHEIDRVPAEGWDGTLEIYAQPWQQTGEETQLAFAKPRPQVVARGATLVLDYCGQQFRVDEHTTHCRIGRDAHNDLQVKGNYTSRQHAEISYRRDRFVVRDESVNGTYIVDDQGQVRKLRREEDVLTGRGRIGFGALPDQDPNGAVSFLCE